MNIETLRDRVTEARTSGPRDLQIYIHVPFCASKCHFCDWVDDIPVTQLRGSVDIRRRYAEAVCHQIEFWGPSLTLGGYRPTSIYWGGGTPTRLEAAALRDISSALGAAFDLRNVAQHTVESTPNELTNEKLDALAAMGVDRLSIGVQSFDADQLRRAGRAHSVEEAVRSVSRVRSAGVTDINIDLIAGFPDETLATFKRTLEQAVALEPSHISVYSYRATPRTTMAVQTARGVRQALDLDAMIESYELAQDILTAAGFEEYCFSYFARDPAFQFKAGIYGYRLDGDIMGFGAGASSTVGTISMAVADTPLHRFLDDPLTVDRAAPYTLDDAARLFPLFGGALMTRDGLSYEKFERLTGIAFASALKNPQVQAWFRYVENCGARLTYGPDDLRATGSQVHRVYLMNLAYTLNPALQAARHV